MSHFFNLVGHIVPNADSELHLEACEMREIWKEYKDDMVAYFGESEESCLRYSAFLRLWSIAFSHVKVREYKQVAGKCGTCMCKIVSYEKKAQGLLRQKALYRVTSAASFYVHSRKTGIL